VIRRISTSGASRRQEISSVAIRPDSCASLAAGDRKRGWVSWPSPRGRPISGVTPHRVWARRTRPPYSSNSRNGPRCLGPGGGAQTSGVGAGGYDSRRAKAARSCRPRPGGPMHVSTEELGLTAGGRRRRKQSCEPRARWSSSSTMGGPRSVSAVSVPDCKYFMSMAAYRAGCGPTNPTDGGLAPRLKTGAFAVSNAKIVDGAHHQAAASHTPFGVRPVGIPAPRVQQRLHANPYIPRRAA